MNRFSKTHPIALFLYFASVISIAMFLKNPVLQLIALVGGGVYAVMLTKGKNLLGEMGFYIILFLLIAVTNPLFSHSGVTPLFFLNDNPVTLEALFYGISFATAITAVILWFFCVTKIFTSEKFLFLFGKVSPRLAVVFTMTLNFIPKLKKQFLQNEKSQKALGIFSTKSRTDRLKLRLRTFFSTVSQSAEDSVELSDSMRGRGYGTKKRTCFQEYKFSRSDYFILSITALAIFIEAFAYITGSTEFDFYPKINLSVPDFLGLTAYTVYALLCFLPILIEITESLKWKYFVSKI